MIEVWERAEQAAARLECDQAALGYIRARQISREDGGHCYWATWLLPRSKRPYAHALLGFVRRTHGFIDSLEPNDTTAERSAQFDRWRQRVWAEITNRLATDPVTAAVIDTIDRWRIPATYLSDFLQSVAMDLTVTEYDSYPELAEYMWGSSAVIGLQVLPILGYRADRSDLAQQSMVSLAEAIQLTTFISEIGEDLDRGRIYLPQESLRWSGVDREHLAYAKKNHLVDAPIRRLLALEIERARQKYRRAEAGIAYLDVDSQGFLWSALGLNRTILDRVERCDYQIFGRRITAQPFSRARAASRGVWHARRTGVGKR